MNMKKIVTEIASMEDEHLRVALLAIRHRQDALARSTDARQATLVSVLKEIREEASDPAERSSLLVGQLERIEALANSALSLLGPAKHAADGVDREQQERVGPGSLAIVNILNQYLDGALTYGEFLSWMFVHVDGPYAEQAPQMQYVLSIRTLVQEIVKLDYADIKGEGDPPCPTCGAKPGDGAGCDDSDGCGFGRE